MSGERAAPDPTRARAQASRQTDRTGRCAVSFLSCFAVSVAVMNDSQGLLCHGPKLLRKIEWLVMGFLPRGHRTAAPL